MLGKQGWFADRYTRHGTLYISPDGQHRFLMPQNLDRCDYRGIKKDMARLKREGGQALELWRALVGKAEHDLHLPRINPLDPPAPYEEQYLKSEAELLKEIGGLDTAQYMALSPIVQEAKAAEVAQIRQQKAEKEAALALAEAPIVTRPSMRSFSDIALRRVGFEVLRVIIDRFGGDLTKDKTDTQRAVTTALRDFATYSSRHIAVGVSYCEEQGWVESYWPNGPGSRTGRTRITVTPAGYEALGREFPHRQPDLAIVPEEEPEEEPVPDLGSQTPAEAMETVTSYHLRQELAELTELVKLYETERDEAVRERDDIVTQLRDTDRSLTKVMEELEELKQRPPQGQAYQWQTVGLRNAVAVLEQADRAGFPARDQLLGAAIMLIEATKEPF